MPASPDYFAISLQQKEFSENISRTNADQNPSDNSPLNILYSQIIPKLSSKVSKVQMTLAEDISRHARVNVNPYGFHLTLSMLRLLLS